MKEIPFFYFDIRARIIPGALVLATIGMAAARLDWKIPKPYNAWMTGNEAWKSVVVPLTLFALIYLIGDAINTILRPVANGIGRRIFHRVVEERLSLYPSSIPKFASEQEKDSYRFDLWEWLILAEKPRESGAFSHAHRFQSEARMFLNASVPAALLTFVAIFAQNFLPYSILNYGFSGLAGMTILAGFLYCAYNCEKRRWTQTFSAARQLYFCWRGRE
jgi:hypothetical protein